VVHATLPYRGRLAPSPTGAQHIGNARTFLIAWLAARSAGGEILLRIEDIDSPRVKPDASQQALDDLRWLGLDWDGGVVHQTRRLALYERAFEYLRERELVYPCTCSRADVERAASAPHAGHEGPPYPGTCAGRQSADAEHLGTAPYSWRFRTDACESITFDDRFCGSITLDPRVLGDFVIWKSAGTPAYQLAVVVDDHDQGITDVVRGDDLLPSTPRQILLYQAFGWQPPRFSHLPLVVGPDGRRLAKRHGDTRLGSLRKAAVKPEALIGLLAYSCGWLEKPEPITPRKLLERFVLKAIPAEPWTLNAAALELIGYHAN
jgi:glutamyl-tRNA synthetase